MKSSRTNKTLVIAALSVSVIVISALAVFGMIPTFLARTSETPKLGVAAAEKPKSRLVPNPSFTFGEGPVLTPTITVGPFYLNRRYRSSEGPIAETTINVGDLAQAKNVVLPETLVRYGENDPKPAMWGDSDDGQKVRFLPDTSRQAAKLFWLKGLKLEVLDENDVVQPTADFVSHFYLDVNAAERNRILPEGERCELSRLVTLTPGQTQISFPDGFAVPAASTEHWHFHFQATNETTDKHRRVKQRLTVYLLPDKTLVQPITALNWCAPTDKNAPPDQNHEKLEHQWVVPPQGEQPSHFYEDNDFARPKWTYEREIEHSEGDKMEAANLPPIFSAESDGPMLSQARTVKLQTSQGPLSFTLRPDWAPKTATQMAKLFQNHVFDGTDIPRYEPDFIIQFNLAESKAPGQAPLSPPQKALIRRIPLEVDQQFSKQIEHGPGMLTMARQENDTVGNTTSFSVCLGKAPHLDTKYTIFGKLTDDPENAKTIKKIIAGWPKHPYVIKTSVMQSTSQSPVSEHR